MAGRARRTDAGSAHRRARLLWPRHQDRFPAHRHLSHPVVSGINVGILAFAVFWLLRKLPFGETWATILTLVLSWGYAFVADLGSPIVRATITLNIYLLTRLLFRDRAGLNALGIAALGILLVNPRTLSRPAFS